MSASGNVDWDTCTQDDCIGVRLPTGNRCWAHADEQNLEAALRRLGEDGDLDARGVQVTSELLERILAAAPHDDRRPILTAVDFERATFTDDAEFDGVRFEGDARFWQATFQQSATFQRATFRRGCGSISGTC